MPPVSGLLLVNSIFGNTVQGEGRSLGRPVNFLRLYKCNQHCVFCDTWETWRTSDHFPHNLGAQAIANEADEAHPMSWESIVKALSELQPTINSLVISGGEPFLQQASLYPLLEYLKNLGWWIEIETAVTIAPLIPLIKLFDQFNCSPKLANSGNPLSLRYRPDVIDDFQATGKAVWKFVVTDLSDFAEIDQLVGTHNLSPVYIMPEGRDAENINNKLRQFVAPAIERGYFISPRLHIQLYGDVRNT